MGFYNHQLLYLHLTWTLQIVVTIPADRCEAARSGVACVPHDLLRLTFIHANWEDICP